MNLFVFHACSVHVMFQVFAVIRCTFLSADFSVSFDRTSYPERYYLSCLPDKKTAIPFALTCRRFHRCHIQVHDQVVHVLQGPEAS